MQAAIITSYKDFDQLSYLVDKLLSMEFKVFVHVDKKTFDKNNKQLIRLLNNSERVYLTSKFSINWGSINHLYAIIHLIKKAIEDNDVHFIHLISSQDYPIKSMDCFNSFFSSDNTNIYMTVTNQENFKNEIKSRYAQYYFFQQYDSRNEKIRKMDDLSRKIQRKIGVNRQHFGCFDSIYKGMVWISAPRKVFNYVISFCNGNNSFFRFLYFCRIPEEFFFQTILLNSIYSENVISNNLRFTLWMEKHNSNPAILDNSDFTAIQNSDAFFARKIDPIISKNLIEKIDSSLLYK